MPRDDLQACVWPEGSCGAALYVPVPGTAASRGTAWPPASRHRIPLERGFACRPAEVATRQSFGHCQGDLLIFARDGGNANVTTLLERRSRFLVLLPNPDLRPAGVAQRIQAALGGLASDLRRTVTFDRGFEFRGYPALDRTVGTTSYFCDPRSSWQQGAVENVTGRLRRQLPSEVPAERLMAESLQTLADRFNVTPRRCLGYRTPAEVLNGGLGPAAGKAVARPAESHQRRKVHACCPMRRRNGISSSP